MITKDTKKVLVVMERYNLQLGNYCVIREGEVKKVLKNTVTVEVAVLGERKFDLEGYEKKPTQSVYGSATYHAYTTERAKELFDGEKFNHSRISQGIELLQAIA